MNGQQNNIGWNRNILRHFNNSLQYFFKSLKKTRLQTSMYEGNKNHFSEPFSFLLNDDVHKCEAHWEK